jgi:enterochelin esterase-like enzyme
MSTVSEPRAGRSRAARLIRHAPLLAVALVWLVIGLGGAYSYWENYYLHRGFGPVALLKDAGRGRQLIVHFYSPALGRTADYLVYLPPHYAPRSHRYPVLYLLHGTPGSPQVFQAVAHIYDHLDNLLALRRIRPMILVMPDGRIDGNTFSDSEWANTPSGNFQSYVVEVVHNVDRRFATLDQRRYRMIAGFSMGGFGALNIGLHNLALFGSIEVWSGYFQETRSGVFAHATSAELYDNSPREYVPRLRAEFERYPVRIFLYVGDDDPLGRYTVPMAAELRAAGADASAAVYPGGHDWRLWIGHESQMLELASRWLREPPPAPAAADGARLAGRPLRTGASQRSARSGGASSAPKANTPASSHGPSPGIRPKRTETKRRLRVSA